MQKTKKERYIDRWMRGKKRMNLILKEEEFNAIKNFCDSNQISYREYFTEIAPKLLNENRELKKSLEEKEKEIENLNAELNDIVTKYNDTIRDYDSLKEKHEELETSYTDLSTKYNELTVKLKELNYMKEQLQKTESELTHLREVLRTLINNAKIDLPAEYCEKLKEFGFRVETTTRGTFKKETITVCTNA